MTTIRRIVTSQINGNDANTNDVSEIRPFGEAGFYVDSSGANAKLVLSMFEGQRTHLRSKVLSPGVFYGSNADSGEGAGLDTIKLIPDATLHYNNGSYGNDQYLVIDPTTPNHIHIRAGGTIDNSTADLFLGGEQTHVKISDGNDSVTVRTSQVGEGIINRDWVFANDGTLTLPSNLAITPAGNFAPISGTAFLQEPTETLIMFASGEGGGIQLGWTQEMLAPGKVAAISFNTPTVNAVEITTGDFTGTVHTWTFDADGIARYPDGTTSTGRTVFANSSSYKIQTISFGGSPSNVVSTYEFGVASITIPGNGIIKNEGFEGAWALDGANGSLTFPNDSRISYGLNNAGLTIDDLKVQAINTGNVVISANGEDWKFGNDGTLTFPDSSVQATAYNPVSGSWNVTTGTNTYSFTVPLNGTYSLWVKGNIPNGIVIWNATVSVSNPNVPAIGTQYAWNYTGAGSPLLLTAIPDQIKGIAGTISTDSSYAGTASNVFAFEISNTSGSAQAVYYGYTKI